MSEAAADGGLVHEFVAYAEAVASGAHTVDPWGFDHGAYDLAARAGRLRWAVRVDGAEHVPSTGAALLVVNRRFGVSEPAVVAMGVHEASGRRVRPVGIPDVPVLGELLRRLGGVLDAPAEIRGLLRAGEVVAVPCTRQPLHPRVPGMLRVGAVGAALEAGAPVLPVAVRGTELGLAWHVRVGGPVPCPAAGSVEARAVACADAARDALADLLR